MKERTLRCGLGAVHPAAARTALITQCCSLITYHPTVPNWFSRQFDPVAETIHSIRSEAIIRVAKSDCSARLAVGLKAAPLASTHIFQHSVRQIQVPDEDSQGSMGNLPLRSAQEI